MHPTRFRHALLTLFSWGTVALAAASCGPDT
jgi:hypothetical protein